MTEEKKIKDSEIKETLIINAKEKDLIYQLRDNAIAEIENIYEAKLQEISGSLYMLVPKNMSKLLDLEKGKTMTIKHRVIILKNSDHSLVITSKNNFTAFSSETYHKFKDKKKGRMFYESFHYLMEELDKIGHDLTKLKESAEEQTYENFREILDRLENIYYLYYNKYYNDMDSDTEKGLKNMYIYAYSELKRLKKQSDDKGKEED